MNLYLIIFTSDTYKAEQAYERHKELFVALEKSFTLHLVYYKQADTIPANAYKMAFIANGKVSDIVVRNFSILPYPITLLADGQYNSLAAALEIAAWVRMKDMKVQIIHGTPADMVGQVLVHHRAFAAKRALKGKRIGVVGAPAPWLVASHVDYLLAGQRWGVNYIDISTEEVYKRFYEISNDDIGVEASTFATRAQACQDTSPDELLRAMRLYAALKRLCEAERLDAITLSSVQMRQELKASDCMAISLLNDEGIPAGGEGDLQSIMTLLMVKELTGQSAFMGNPAFVDTGQNSILLSHCSIGTKLTDAFILRTHFESESGIAIQGILHEGEITLFKCGGECLDEYYVSGGYLTENCNLLTTCRTQCRLKLDEPVSYFLQNPIGTHHIMLQGNHVDDIREFMQQNRCKRKQ